MTPRLSNFIFIFFIIVLFLTIVSADNLEIKMNEINIVPNNITKNLFDIKNLDYYTTKNIINVALEYNITYENEIIKTENILFKEFKYRKYSGTGDFIPTTNDTYIICGKITIISNITTDSDLSNNKICFNTKEGKIINDTKESIIKCDYSPEIELKNENMKVDEGKIYFRFNQKKIYDENEEQKNNKIEYWIEDQKGNIIKKIQTTTNNQYKEFTIKNTQPEILFIRAKIITECKDTDNSNDETYKTIIINKSNENYSSFLIKDIKEIGDTIILRTNIKKNIETDNNVVKIWIENNNKKISNDMEFKIFSEFNELDIEFPIIISRENNPKTAEIVVNAFGNIEKNIISLKETNEIIYDNTKEYSNINLTKTNKTELNIKINNIEDISYKIDDNKKWSFWSLFKGNKTENIINNPSNNQNMSVFRNSTIIPASIVTFASIFAIFKIK